MIEVRCGCGRAFSVRDEGAGRRAKCPACGQSVNIPIPGLTDMEKNASKPPDPREPDPSPAAVSEDDGEPNHAERLRQYLRRKRVARGTRPAANIARTFCKIIAWVNFLWIIGPWIAMALNPGFFLHPEGWQAGLPSAWTCMTVAIAALACSPAE